MHQIAKYEVIFLLCILIKSASTAKMKTTCKGAVETGIQDFKTINVTKTTSKSCGFSISSLNLAKLSRDLVLFDTARMNCQGGEVRFPSSGPGKKNYCDSDRCKVYTRKLDSYNRNDVLETVRNHFPSCAGYDIQRKVERDITVQKQTTAFTLRYKLLNITLAPTAIPTSSAATKAGDYSSATAPYSLSQTESVTARDEGGVTTAVPDGTKDVTSFDVTSSTIEDGVSRSTTGILQRTGDTCSDSTITEFDKLSGELYVKDETPNDCDWIVNWPADTPVDAIIMRINHVWIDCSTGYLRFKDSQGDGCGICETAELEDSTEYCQIYANGEVCTEEEIWQATHTYFPDCTKTVIHRSLNTMSVHLVTDDRRFREFTLDYQLHACKGPGDRVTALLGSGPAVSNKISALDRLEDGCPVVVGSQHSMVETSPSPDVSTVSVTTYADELITSPQTYTEEARSSAHMYVKEDITTVLTYTDEANASIHMHTNEDTASVHTHTEEDKAGVHMLTNESTANTQKPPSTDVSGPTSNQDDAADSNNTNTGQRRRDQAERALREWKLCWIPVIILAILLTLSVFMHIVMLCKRRKHMRQYHVGKSSNLA